MKSRKNEINPSEAAEYVMEAVRELAPEAYASLLNSDPTSESIKDWGNAAAEAWASEYRLASKFVAWKAAKLLRETRPYPSSITMNIGCRLVLPAEETAWLERINATCVFPPDPRATTLAEWQRIATRIYHERATKFVSESHRAVGARGELPKHCRWLVLARVREVSQGEIARKQGITRPAVTLALSRLSSALQFDQPFSLSW